MITVTMNFPLHPQIIKTFTFTPFCIHKPHIKSAFTWVVIFKLVRIKFPIFVPYITLAIMCIIIKAECLQTDRSLKYISF